MKYFPTSTRIQMFNFLGCNPVPVVSNAVVSYSTDVLDDDSYSPGTVATISCNSGYFFVDDRTLKVKTRTCEKSNGFNGIDTLGSCTNS